MVTPTTQDYVATATVWGLYTDYIGLYRGYIEMV